MRRRALVWGIAVVILALALAYGLSGKSGGARAKAAPTLPRELLSGTPLSIAQLRGHPALVTFWASWCENCSHEAAAIERFSRSPAGRGRIVGVDYIDGLSGARSFIRHYGWTFTTLRDGEGTVGQHYEVGVLPTTYVLDAQGRIHATLIGPQTEQTLTRALAAAARA